MTRNTHQPLTLPQQEQPPSWQAKYDGCVLGYFRTANEAQACVDAAVARAEADRDAE